MGNLDALSPDQLNAILAAAEAQREATRQKQAELNLQSRQQMIALEQIAGTEHLSQDVRQFIKDVGDFLEYLKRQAIWQDRIFEDIANRIDRLESNMLLLLTEHSQQKIETARQELEQEKPTRAELSKRRRNLAKLKQQAANYGAIDVPLVLQNKIEAEELAIEELNQNLNQQG